MAPVILTPDAVLFDLPANHPRHAGCLVLVDRRFEQEETEARDVVSQQAANGGAGRRAGARAPARR